MTTTTAPRPTEPAAAPDKQQPERRDVRPLPELLCQRYQTERLLGVGGMAGVYKARDLLREGYGDPEPFVAIKALNDYFAQFPDANALLYSEFALTSRLHHGHIVQLFGFDIDTDSDRAFIILEPLRGPTLDQYLADRHEGSDWESLREMVLPLLDALDYAHQHGVIHGDIKPNNVMLAEQGVRLFDFGLGQPMEGLLPGLPRLSRQRIAAWTPRYAALELLNGEALTPAADIYAIACVIYELSSGHHPFSRLTAKQAKAMHQHETLERPALLPPHCWPALRTALAFDATDRQITAAELRESFAASPPKLLQRLLGSRK